MNSSFFGRIFAKIQIDIISPHLLSEAWNQDRTRFPIPPSLLQQPRPRNQRPSQRKRRCSLGGLLCCASMAPRDSASGGLEVMHADGEGTTAKATPAAALLRDAEEREHEEILLDDKGRPYDLGPKGFVRDLNTRAVKIARRVVEKSRAKEAASASASASAAATFSNSFVTKSSPAAAEQAALAAAAAVAADKGTSGTVRSSIAQEIQFVLGGRLPFVKRSEHLVYTWLCVSLFFLVRCGLLECGVAPTVGAFTVMYFVLDFYSGVLHVVLDDEWNMRVPLLSQPAMEFQYHHHIPDDGCSRPFVEGMGDLNFIVALHLALFVALFVRGGGEDYMLLTAGGWKMLLAYWGIWNHRQVSERATLFFYVTMCFTFLRRGLSCRQCLRSATQQEVHQGNRGSTVTNRNVYSAGRQAVSNLSVSANARRYLCKASIVLFTQHPAGV